MFIEGPIQLAHAQSWSRRASIEHGRCGPTSQHHVARGARIAKCKMARPTRSFKSAQAGSSSGTSLRPTRRRPAPSRPFLQAFPDRHRVPHGVDHRWWTLSAPEAL